MRSKRKAITVDNPSDEKKQKTVEDEELLIGGPASALSELDGKVSLKRKQGGGEDDSVTSKQKNQTTFLQALQASRKADEANFDHVAVRKHVQTAFREEPTGAKEKWPAEIQRIGTVGEWATFEDWKLFRKVLNIGFHVYQEDKCGGIEFGWSDPQDDTAKRLVMVAVLFNGVHYDLIVFGELTDDQLNGFV